MKLAVGLFILIFSYLPYSLATSFYSPSEGYLDQGHDLALNKYRQKYFYGSSGKIDPTKIKSLISFLEFQKSLLLDSAKMNRKTNLIMAHGYDNDRAEKEGIEAQSVESETIAPFIFALDHSRDLLARYNVMTASQIHEKVETILLFIGAAYTPYPTTIFTAIIERAKNLAENFFEFPLEDSRQTQASNLLLNGVFASQSNLQAYRQSGNDISKLNPASSAIWTDNEVEAYDPYLEIYWNKKFFPPRDQALPVFHYERMGNGNIKFKTHWFDPKELNKKGLPKKKDVTLRVGMESYTASVVNHFARIVGYPANPTTFRKAIKLELGDIGFEEFLVQWRLAHGLELGTAVTHIERIPNENAVILKNVTLEAYPDKDEYRKMGPFRMGDNGLRNRREYRAMVLYNSLISLQDHFEYQSRVDAIKDESRGWLPLFFISDTSSALGLPAMLGNRGTVNEFTWEFTRRDDRQVRLFWFSVFNSRTWKDTTYSDVKWLARRFARICTQQIDGILETSGFPAPVKALYAEKFKSRINKMILDFDLQKEGYRLHSVRSAGELANMFPEYINEKGFLKEGAQEIPGNTLPILGNRFTPLQGIVVGAINALHKKLLSVFNPADYSGSQFVVDLGRTTTTGGIGIEASRSVSVNPELGPGQRRYLLKDRMSISLPLGLFSYHVETPLALYYTYTFEYIHSVSTMKEVGKSRFFPLLNPFSIQDIRQNLGIGEQLQVNHSVGASVGKAKLKVNENIQIEAALVGLDFTSLKSMYFSKPHPTLFEIVSDHVTTKGIQSGVDIRTYLRLAAKMRGESSKKTYKIYRLDTLNETPSGAEKVQQAFDSVLIDNDFTLLEQIATPLELRDSAKNRNFELGFLVWNFADNVGTNDLWVDGQRVVVAHKTQTFDRAFNRFWNDKVSISAGEPAANYLGEFWGEGKRTHISFEGVVNPTTQRFSEMEVQISLSIFDNYCTRQEFEKNFKPYFNSRSGSTKYIQFPMPDELDAYPELQGTMKWQLSKAAIRDILLAATDRHKMAYLMPGGSQYSDGQLSANDPREDIAFRAVKLLSALDRPTMDGPRPYTVEAQAKDLVHVIDALMGYKSSYVGEIRKFTSANNIWMTTSIANMLDISHPTFRDVKRNAYWGPEVGRFQGHSFLERFRRTRHATPLFQ